MKTLILAFSSFVLMACGAAERTTCTIIHAADEACTVLEYVGTDGQTHQVPVSKQDLQSFGTAMTMKRQGLPK